MAKRKTKKETRPSSIFRKLEINSISEIFELYLFYDLTQELVNGIANECGKFLMEKKEITPEVANYLSFQFIFQNNDPNDISVLGNNLLSSLWIIGVYPPKPELLIDKTNYKNGDFIYKFYTKNKNLSVKPNNNHERKLTSNQ